MQHVSNFKAVALIFAALICIPVSSRAATQSLDDFAGYWVSTGNFGNVTLTRFFEITVREGQLVIHSTALKFEVPNRPPEISEPAPDETYEFAVRGSELIGVHRTASYRSDGCAVEASSELVSGQILENGQISLEVNTGHVVHDATPTACHLDYGDAVTVTVWLSRRMDN